MISVSDAIVPLRLIF